MSEEIIKVLDDLGKKLGIAIDWSSQNIMPYLQELGTRFIKFQNANSIIWIIISMICIIAGIVLVTKMMKWKKDEEIEFLYDEIGFLLFFAILGIILVVIWFTFTLFSNIFAIVQNIYMPEMTILEYIKTINI